MKNGNFLSEAETDFIFAVIGEEFGFKGSIAVIILLLLTAMECISVAVRAKDVAGTIIPEFCKHRSGYIYSTKYGTSFTVCKLRTDIFTQSVYRNGYCTEYSTAGKEKLRIIEEKKGYRI